MQVMRLDRFSARMEILIDDAGWGDFILGVVIGALKLPDRRYMERRIPVSSFQPPNFKNKQYLDGYLKEFTFQWHHSYRLVNFRRRKLLSLSD
jgi:hypothetical protein